MAVTVLNYGRLLQFYARKVGEYEDKWYPGLKNDVEEEIEQAEVQENGQKEDHMRYQKEGPRYMVKSKL